MIYLILVKLRILSDLLHVKPINDDDPFQLDLITIIVEGFVVLIDLVEDSLDHHGEPLRLPHLSSVILIPTLYPS